jgi:hypothetical protein
MCILGFFFLAGLARVNGRNVVLLPVSSPQRDAQPAFPGETASTLLRRIGLAED